MTLYWYYYHVPVIQKNLFVALNSREIKIISKHTGKSGDIVTLASLSTMVIKRNLSMFFFNGPSNCVGEMDFKVERPWNTENMEHGISLFSFSCKKSGGTMPPSASPGVAGPEQISEPLRQQRIDFSVRVY